MESVSFKKKKKKSDIMIICSSLCHFWSKATELLRVHTHRQSLTICSI